MLGTVDRGGDGDDENVAGAQLLGVGGEGQVFRFGQFGWLDFMGAVTTCPELVDAALLDVEAGDGVFLAKLDSQRQTYVAEADDGDAGVAG